VVLLPGGPAAAENIDSGGDDSQYAWGENVGWINAEPSGDGGPGVHVSDFELTGWMWGENVGWISLSCQSGSTCGTTHYGVLNDGSGVLSGYAWGENVGWIDFAPATAGVVIDAATGEFWGAAWGENIGWIRFASSGPNPFVVTTGWNCDPAPAAPTGSPGLTIDKSGTDAELSWGVVAGATGYDIVSGDLGSLRSSGGSFTTATSACLSNNGATTSLTDSSTPAAGQGVWFLVRGENCGGKGTYDSGRAMQVGLRDAEIASSGDDCP
jgi:hypothetical protein